MNRPLLREGLRKAASSDEDFEKYADIMGVEFLKVFMYGVGAGMFFNFFALIVLYWILK